jgi:RNA polymerase sigma-32 factor
VLSCLDNRERAIIESRFLRDDAVTLDALGARFGISRERVRQVEVRALAKLRDAVAVA